MSLSRLELLTFRLSNEHSTIELQARRSRREGCFIGVEGFEPSVMVPKTTALPLGYTPGGAAAGEEGIEPPPLSLKPRILAVELFPR